MFFSESKNAKALELSLSSLLACLFKLPDDFVMLVQDKFKQGAMAPICVGVVQSAIDLIRGICNILESILGDTFKNEDIVSRFAKDKNLMKTLLGTIQNYPRLQKIESQQEQ
jgi:hypothetical protein